jgi:hypothetical protein
MKDNYSEQRKIRVGNLNRNKFASEMALMSDRMKLRYLEADYKGYLREYFSNPIRLYNVDGTIHSEYKSKTEAGEKLKTCRKTINKHLENNKLFRNIGYFKCIDKTK